MIGVDNWSIELQKSEFYSLYLLLLKINEELLVIKDQLMDEESIILEFESFWSWKATTVLVFPKSIASVPDKLSYISNYLNQLSSFCNLFIETVE